MHAAVYLGVAILSFAFIRISYKTSIPIAFYDVILQTILALLGFIIVLMVIYCGIELLKDVQKKIS